MLLLYILLAILIAWGFMALKEAKKQQNKKQNIKRVANQARSVMRKVMSRGAAKIKTPCDYFAEDFPKSEGDCKAYQEICGLGSTVSEILNLDESSSGSGDTRVRKWLAADLANVQKDKSQCAPAPSCPNGQSDCPSMFPLSCKNNACI